MTGTNNCKFCSEGNSKLDKNDWIQCGKCKEWYHYSCLELTEEKVVNISIYVCPTCEPEFGKSIPRRVSSRKKAVIDYLALDDGDTVGFQRLHPYCQYFKTGDLFDSDHIKEKNGDEVIDEWNKLNVNDIPEPVIIRKKDYNSLDMNIPNDLTVEKVASLLGDDTPLEVMDVATQSNSPGWTLGKWKDYYYSAESDRDKIRNVISLEFSYTKLADEIKRPKIVREFDLVDKIWPSELRDKEEYPKVTLYCLMSVADSYTDFHVDFGGSSVFYHVCQGAKTFLFVPPTVKNLQKYEKWCLSSNQNSTFFGNLVKECYRVDLKKGDSMIIPSGWIHAVFTPIDSLVIGGNFLSKDSLPMELKLTEIEKRTKVPRKFLFPHFNRVLWYIVIYHVHKPTNIDITKREADGLYTLGQYLYNELQTKESKLILQALSNQYKKDYINLLNQFMANICKILDNKPPPPWIKQTNETKIKRNITETLIKQPEQPSEKKPKILKNEP